MKRNTKTKKFDLFLKLKEIHLSVYSLIRSIPKRVKTKSISKSTFIVSKNIRITHIIIIMVIFMSTIFSGRIFPGVNRIKKSPINKNVKPTFIFN